MDCLITRVCTTDIRTVYHCHGGVLEKVTRHGIPQGFSEVKTQLENQIDRTVWYNEFEREALYLIACNGEIKVYKSHN